MAIPSRQRRGRCQPKPLQRGRVSITRCLLQAAEIGLVVLPNRCFPHLHPCHQPTEVASIRRQTMVCMRAICLSSSRNPEKLLLFRKIRSYRQRARNGFRSKLEIVSYRRRMGSRDALASEGIVTGALGSRMGLKTSLDHQMSSRASGEDTTCVIRLRCNAIL